MNKSLLLQVVALFLCSTAFAQFKEPDIIPPSPEAANLLKYAKVPVSYNTGVPQIQIPLYDLTVNDMRLPIALSYHASGVKVNEVASWCGMGWSLTANGAITRVMRGRPDESSFGYFNKTQWDTWQDMATWVTGEPQMSGTDDATTRHNFQLAVAKGEKDLQPDVFYVNFAGYSGRIYFDVDKKPVIVPYQDLKISHPFDYNNTAWVITTPDGIEYTFKNSDAEMTTPLNEGINQPAFYSTWYLSSVRSLKQPGFITFNYATASLNGIETTPSSGVILGRLDYADTTCTKDPGAPTGMGTNTYSITTKRLISIQFTNGTITFQATADRQDKYQNVNYTGHKLNSLVVTSGSQHVKTVSFFYSYKSNRLYLDSLTETGKNSYQFKYNTTPLPAATSYQQDHWGYCNDGINNKSLIPSMDIEEAAFYRSNAEYSLAKADRNSSSNTTAGLLQQITYPTRGVKAFTFEPNAMYVFNNPVPASVTVQATGGKTNPSMNSYDQGQLQYFKDQQYQIIGGPVFVRSSTFILKSETTVKFSFSASSSDGGQIADVAQVNVYKVPVNYNNPVAFNMNGSKVLDAGTYIAIAAASQSAVTVTGGISYVNNVPSNLTIGGARVKEITDTDGKTVISRTSFVYNLPTPILIGPQPGTIQPQDGLPNTPNGIIYPSSGTVFEMPVYKNRTPCGRLYISSQTVMPTSSFEGYHIGYSRVEEIRNTSASDAPSTVKREAAGRIIHMYQNNINDILRDLEDQTIYLAENGDTVKHIKYSYSNEGCYGSGSCPFSSYAPSIEMKRKEHKLLCNIFGTNCTKDYYTFDVIQKRFNTFFLYTTKVIEKNFSKEDYPRFITTVTETKAGREVPGSYQQSHTLPTEITTTHPNGITTTEKLINSPEEAAPGTDIKTPVRRLVVRNTGTTKLLVNAEHYTYGSNLLTAVQIFQPSVPAIYTDGMEVPLVPRFFMAYDNQKIVRKRKADGAETAFIWDTNLLNPIAEITNAGGEAVAFTSFENSGNEGNWNFSMTNTVSGKIGQNAFLSSGQNISTSGLNPATVYKVSYWAKNGTPSVTNVQSSIDTITVAGWTYYEYLISGTTQVTVSSTSGTCIDDLRLYPSNARMRSFTYKPFIGLTSVTDANGVTESYDYNPAGQLETVRDTDGNFRKRFQYHYKK